MGCSDVSEFEPMVRH